MLNTVKLIAFSVLFSLTVKAQVLYNESFSNLALLTYSNSSVTFNYNLLPGTFSEIRDGHRNDHSAYNKPFTAPLLLREGWAVYNNPPAAGNDTFLVSTSWLDTATATSVDRWAITPPISNIASNSVLSWSAMCPDMNNRDGYEVYITVNTTGTVTVNDFNSSNRVFSLYDIDNGGTGEATTWTRHGVNLSAYAGLSVRVAFRTVSKDKFQLWLDDIMVQNMPTILDLSVNSVDYNKYPLLNNTDVVSATVQNNGYTNVNSFTLNYKVGGNIPFSQSFGLSAPLMPFAVTQVTLAVPFSLSASGYNGFKTYISAVNGTLDNVRANDTISSFVTGIISSNNKKVLLKEFVSANDGWSADAQVLSGYITSSDTNAVSMAIHTNDNMATAAGNSMFGVYNPPIPSATIDDKYWADINELAVEKNAWAARVQLRETGAAPVLISVLNKSYNSSTRHVSFDVKLDFAAQLKSTYCLHTMLVENNVCGPFNDNTVNNWNQLSNLFSVPTSPYYQMGAYYDGESYILNPYVYMHQRVLLEALDGPAGDNSIIPASGVNIGQSLTKNYSYTLPMPANNGNMYNADNIYVVAYVEEFDTVLTNRLIVNTMQGKLTMASETIPVSVHEEAAALAGAELYPNPASGATTLLLHNSDGKACSIRLVNNLGQTLYTWQTTASATVLDLSGYPAGLYTVLLESGGRQVTKKLMISK